jgi:TP901 family phage tail tape measure protein
MADFEKVYQLDFNTEKAEEGIKRLESFVAKFEQKLSRAFSGKNVSKSIESLISKVGKADKSLSKGLGIASDAALKMRATFEKSMDRSAGSSKKVRAGVGTIEQALDRARTAGARLDDALGKGSASSGMKKTSSEALKAASSTNKLRSGMSRVAASETKVKEAGDALFRMMKKASRAGESGMKKVERAMVATEKATKKTDEAISKMLRPKGESRKAKALGEIGKRIRRIGSSSKLASTSVTGLVAKVTLLIGAANKIRGIVSDWMDFDDTMTVAVAKFSKFEPQMRPGTKAFGEFKKEVREAAKETEHSATGVARAVDFWAKAGKSSAQTKAVLGATLDFASANTDAAGSMLDVARAGDILSDTLGQFRLDTNDPTKLMENTARVSDVMSAAANSANLSAEELFEGFKDSGPVMTQLEAQIEDVATYLAKMANAGIKGTKAGRSLKIAMSAMNSPTAKQSELFEKYNVKVKDSEGNFRGLTTIIGELSKATENLGTSERFDVFGTIVGREGIAPFLNLLAAGEDKLGDFSAKLRNVSGETKRLADITRQSASRQMQNFWNKVSDLGFTIIEETKLFDRLGKALDGIDWKAATDFITESLLPVLSDVGAVIVDYLWPAVKIVSGALNTVLSPAIDGILGLLSLLRDEGSSVSDSLNSIADDMPKTISKGFSDLYRRFYGFARLAESFVSRWGRLFEGLSTGMVTEWDSAGGHITAGLEMLGESFGTVFEEIRALVYEVVAVFIGGADHVEDRWGFAGEFIGGSVVNLVGVVTGALGTIAKTASAVFGMAVRMITTAIHGIRTSIEGLFAGVMQIMEGDFLGGITRIGVALANAITLPVRAAISGLLKLIEKIPGASSLAESVGINIDDISAAVSEGLTVDAKGNVDIGRNYVEPTPKQTEPEYEKLVYGEQQPKYLQPPEAPRSMLREPMSWEVPISVPKSAFVQPETTASVPVSQVSPGHSEQFEKLYELQKSKADEDRTFQQRSMEMSLSTAKKTEAKTINQKIEIGGNTFNIKTSGNPEDLKRQIETISKAMYRDQMRNLKDELSDASVNEGAMEF